MNLIGKNVVVYGAGVSGLSACDLVREKGGRAVLFDDNPSIACATDSVKAFESADIIILSPGVQSDKDFLLDAKLENKLVLCELELASLCCAAKQIAITGTNGKTTTTLLVDKILKCAHKKSHAVGNIGAAFSAIADRLDTDEIAVIEASSFQLESAVNFAPDVAVLLNITPDHLERHGSMKKYIAAKSNIFLKQSECDVVIYNADDANIAQLVPMMVAKKIPFSTSRPVDGAYVSSGFICYKGKPIIALTDIDMKGGELQNALAAVAVGMSQDVSAYTIAGALSNFERPKYRREYCGEIDGIRVYNDSKATNIDACVCAVKGMRGGTVLILGGAKRNEDFETLFTALPRNISACVVCGENAEIIRSAAEKKEFCEVFSADSLEDALKKAIEAAKEKNLRTILFSPASKSFDLYSGYEERGREFDKIAQSLGVRKK